MKKSIWGTLIFILMPVLWLVSLSGFRCIREGCSSMPFDFTNTLRFKVVNNQGHSHLDLIGFSMPAADSIKLKDLRTGQFYPLFQTRFGVDTVITTGYVKQTPAMDSLVFYFGQSVPDTLLLTIGRISSSRGDNCGTMQDAGITKVMLRGQTIFETTADQSLITFVK